jgi:hypothetical protein
MPAHALLEPCLFSPPRFRHFAGYCLSASKILELRARDQKVPRSWEVASGSAIADHQPVLDIMDHETCRNALNDLGKKLMSGLRSPDGVHFRCNVSGRAAIALEVTVLAKNRNTGRSNPPQCPHPAA